ncbi:hypothetical protein MKEN_00739500 [Mycena kentingensis (nom. inval.)]|nr:hypothetical protein MKEN_00739500 [Mycena kentingensis (nom. inval.)]
MSLGFPALRGPQWPPRPSAKIQDPALQRLIDNHRKRATSDPKLVDAPPIAFQPTLNPSFVPLQNAPESVRDAIWSRILCEAVEIPEHDWGDGEHYLTPHPVRPKRLPILLTCKLFYRLGRPHYYRSISFAEQLDGMAGFSSWVADTTRPLVVNRIVTSRSQWIISRTCMTWAQFETLLDRTGDSLVVCDLSVKPAVEELPPDKRRAALGALPRQMYYQYGDAFGSRRRHIDPRTMFARLPNLSRLGWDNTTAFSEIEDGVDVGELPKLAALWIRQTDPTFVDALLAARLPRLNTLYATTNTVNYAPFLTVHGGNITSLHLLLAIVDEMAVAPSDADRLVSLCPNVVELVVIWPTNQPQAPPPQRILASRMARRRSRYADSEAPKFHKLKKIKFRMRFLPYNNSKREVWADYLLRFDPSECPALEELHVHALAWPVKEHDIQRSKFVKAAERLLDMGVHLAGENGVRWRSRLQSGVEDE